MSTAPAAVEKYPATRARTLASQALYVAALLSLFVGASAMLYDREGTATRGAIMCAGGLVALAVMTPRWKD